MHDVSGVTGVGVECVARCRLPAMVEWVRPAVDRMLADLHFRGMADAVLKDVELATIEALNNAVIHGCQENGQVFVDLEWMWERNLLMIRVFDPGEFLPPPGRRLDPPAEHQENGRGLYLMAKLMEKVEHRVENTGHVVILSHTVQTPISHGLRPIELEPVLRRMTEELSECYEITASLFKLGEQLASMEDFKTLAETALEEVRRISGADNVCLRLLDEQGKLQLLAVNPIPGILPPETSDIGTVEWKAMSSGEEQCVESWSVDDSDDPLQPITGCAFVIPIRHGVEVYGTLAIGKMAANPFFSAGQTNMTRMVGEFIGISRALGLAQDQKKQDLLARKEVEMAAEIQSSLMPTEFPQGSWFKLSGGGMPAQEVGGDYFDAISIGDEGTLLVVADVMGKGMRAALISLVMRTLVRANLHLAKDPGEFLTVLNRQLQEDLSRLNMFITAQFAFLPAGTPNLYYGSAGHCPLIIRGPTGHITPITYGGIPLGVSPDAGYSTEMISLKRGETLFLITDGLFELNVPPGVRLGFDGLLKLISTTNTRGKRSAAVALLQALNARLGGLQPEDDRTLLAVEVL